MQQLTETAENTTAKWEGIITTLTARARTYDSEVADLVHERDRLALDAELGINGAQKRLQKIATDLTTKQNGAQSIRTAIQQAEVKKRQAEQAEAETAENTRTNAMRSYAEEARYAAEQFDAHMSQVVAHGTSFKQVIQKMLTHASNNSESRVLDQLLRPGPYQRAAIAAGMRQILELEPYRGLKEHLRPLEIEISSHLDRWLTPAVVITPGQPPQAPEIETKQAAAEAEPEEDKQGPDVPEPESWTTSLKKKVKFHKRKEK